MDPSVLRFGRPGNSTESLPVSPVGTFGGELFPSGRGAGRGGIEGGVNTAPATPGSHVPPASPTGSLLVPAMNEDELPTPKVANGVIPLPPSVTLSPRIVRARASTLNSLSRELLASMKEEHNEESTSNGALVTSPVGSESIPVLSSNSSPEPAEDDTPQHVSPDPSGTVKKRQRSDSVTTFHGGGAESIFRLLPRETRPALRRMLHVEPGARCTLTDLLKGRGKHGNILCGCLAGFPHLNSDGSMSTLNGVVHEGSKEPGPGNVNGSINGKSAVNSSTSTLSTVHQPYCVDHDCDPEDEDNGDPWLTSIPACSTPGAKPDHVHIKVAVDEKAGKKKFF